MTIMDIIGFTAIVVLTAGVVVLIIDELEYRGWWPKQW